MGLGFLSLGCVSGSFQRFCLFIREAHFQKYLVGRFPVLQPRTEVR